MKHKSYKLELQAYFDSLIASHHPVIFIDHSADLNTIQLYYQYQSIKLVLNNIADSIEFNIKNCITLNTDLELDEFIKQFKNIYIQPVLTAHPTEPFSNQALSEIHNIHVILEDSYPVIGNINDSLLKLINMQLTPMHKLTPEQEIDDNIVYLKKINSYLTSWQHKMMTDIIACFPSINSNQKQQLSDHIDLMVKVRSWVGADADGNDNIDSNTMQIAASKHFTELGKINDIKIDVRQNAAVYNQIFKIIQKSVGISSAIDIINDQNLMTFLKAYITDIDKDSILFKEIERLKMIAQYPNIFENLIIAGVENTNDILIAILLCKIVGISPHIIPLLESKNSLLNSTTIVNNLLNFEPYSEQIDIQKIMIGYSDSERESGIFILPLIHKIIFNLRNIAISKGIKISFFHGNGLDLSRGGPGIIANEQTIQGNHKRFLFSTLKSTINYFTRIVNHSLKPEYNRYFNLIECFSKSSITRYEEVFTIKHDDINQYLSYASPYDLFVKTHNFSSRNTNRNQSNQTDVLTGLRAISQVNTIEGTFTNFNIWLGFKEFINQIKDYTLNNNIDTQTFFKMPLLHDLVASDIYLKAMIAIKMTDFEGARQYFPSHPDSISYKFYQFICNEFEETIRLIDELELRLPQDIKDQIDYKQNLAVNIKQFMASLNQAIVYSDNNHQPKTMQEFFSVNNESSEIITKLMGAIYCGFTEFRTPPLALILY